jgi:hypothetical protein
VVVLQCINSILECRPLLHLNLEVKRLIEYIVLISDGRMYPKLGAGKEPSVAIHLHLQNTLEYVIAYSIGILFLTAATSCSYPFQTVQN